MLSCADGKDNKAVATELRTTEHTAARWRGRGLYHGPPRQAVVLAA